MLSGGLPQIFVSDMDRAVKFYTEVLGMNLEYRFGNHWASLRTGDLTMGLHPESAENPAGRKGSITIGFRVSEPIEDVVGKLEGKGVKFHGTIIQDRGGLKFIDFEDPDGNRLHLAEVKWSPNKASEAQEREYQNA
jgi:catechol 2,3-dioxygenase-like lactoylglutathione lyase family enzyme